MTDDIRKLLGGFATGTLTPDERKALYEASLHDEHLFEALADEQSLKELLEDSTARAQLLQATETPHWSFRGVLAEWFDRPKSKVLVALGAVLVLSIGIEETVWRDQGTTGSKETVAVLHTPPAQQPPPAKEEAVAPAPQPKPVAKAARAKVPEPVAAAAPRLPAMKESVEIRAFVAPRAESAAVPLPVVAQDMAAADPMRVARAGDLELKYTVLLRNAQGEYLPVSPDHEFAPTDSVRLRIEANREGTIAMMGGDEQPLFVRNVTPGSPVVIPSTFEFQNVSEHQLEIGFLQLPSPQMALGYTAAREADKEKKAMSGAPARSALRAFSPPAASLTVRLNLRRKP